MKDLSWPLDGPISIGPYFAPPEFRPLLEIPPDTWRVTELVLQTHLGTHIDAPSHLVPDGHPMEGIAIERLAGKISIIRLPDQPPRSRVSVDDLESYGSDTPEDQLLVVETGWWRRYGTDEYVSGHPWFDNAASNWILSKRPRVVLLDVFTPEMPHDMREHGWAPVMHSILLGAGVPIVENIRLDSVTSDSGWAVIAPLPVDKLDGAPCRIFMWEESEL